MVEVEDVAGVVAVLQRGEPALASAVGAPHSVLALRQNEGADRLVAELAQVVALPVPPLAGGLRAHGAPRAGLRIALRRRGTGAAVAAAIGPGGSSGIGGMAMSARRRPRRAGAGEAALEPCLAARAGRAAPQLTLQDRRVRRA